MTFASFVSKTNIMNDDKNIRQAADEQNIRTENAMKIPVVTQNIPSDGKRITTSGNGKEPTRQQLEQDVLKTNPSVESMESRG